jgi:peptidyl-prolyl cis-trans isomerase D
MLRGLHKASSNWLGKIVMAAVVAFLVLSFAIWGIGDIFRGFGRSTVADIGGTTITVEQFRQVYNDRLQQLARRVGRPITPDQAHALGLDRRLLAQIFSEAVLNERARQLGLGLSDAAVVRVITEDPTFHGPTGAFDQQRFDYIIRQAGYTEAHFIAEQRNMMLRRQLGSAIGGDIKVPQTTAELMDRYSNEQRSVEYMTLDAANAGEIPAPTPEELSKYYEQHKYLFRAPEYRKLQVLVLSPEEMARSIEVSEADAKHYYEQQTARFTKPEKRQVQQIVFPNDAEAAKAHEQLTSGTTFEALAAERKIAPTDLDLGLVTKADMLDPAFAEAAFALKEGEMSAPVKGRLGTAILRVTKIEPGHVMPFAEAEAQVKQLLALNRAKAELGKRRDQIEDELAGGQELDEIGKKLKLPVRTIEAIDRSGRGPDGQPVNIPKQVDLVAQAFNTPVGVENDALRIPGGGFVWYEVAHVSPSRERTFEEAKAQVESRWREAEIGKRLDAKVSAIIDKVKAGTPFAEVAAAEGLKVETASGLKRNSTKPLPASAATELFRTPKDGVASAIGAGPTQRIVFKVTEIKVPPFNAEAPETKKLMETLRTAYSDDLLKQYVAQLESDFGVKINQAALNQAIGRSGSDQP